MANKNGDGKFFAVRDLPDHTRKLIKHYAVEHDVTMGQAVEALVDTALQKKPEPSFIPVPESIVESARNLALAILNAPDLTPELARGLRDSLKEFEMKREDELRDNPPPVVDRSVLSGDEVANLNKRFNETRKPAPSGQEE